MDRLRDLREVADCVVEEEDTATAANYLRSAQDEIERLREALAEIRQFASEPRWTIEERLKAIRDVAARESA